MQENSSQALTPKVTFFTPYGNVIVWVLPCEPNLGEGTTYEVEHVLGIQMFEAIGKRQYDVANKGSFNNTLCRSN